MTERPSDLVGRVIQIYEDTYFDSPRVYRIIGLIGDRFILGNDKWPGEVLGSLYVDELQPKRKTDDRWWRSKYHKKIEMLPRDAPLQLPLVLPVHPSWYEQTISSRRGSR